MLVAVLSLSGALEPIRSLLGDLRFGMMDRDPSGRVVLVDIDEASIRAVGTWPWSRSIHARIVDRLRELDAGDIAFDVDFSSRSAPDGDDAFEAALRRADGTVILAALQQRGSAGVASKQLVASRPLQRFADLGLEVSVDVWPDRDGFVRRFTRGELFGRELLPALATVIAAQRDVSTATYSLDYSIRASRIDHVSVINLLSGTIDKTRIAGRQVIIGATAAELRDFFHVPRFGFVSGPALQAIAAETLIQGRAMQVTSPIVSLCGLGVLVLVFGARRRSWRMSTVLIICPVLALAIEAAAVVVQSRWPFLVNTAPFHIELAAVALIAIVAEIDDRRIKILISRNHADRLRLTLDRVVADSFSGIVVADHEGTVRAVSEAARQMLSFHASSGHEKHFTAVLPPILASVMAETLARAEGGEGGANALREVQCEVRQGHVRDLELVSTVSLIPGLFAKSRRISPDRFAICLTFQDVTERRQEQARIAHLAFFDSLTGLANRHAYIAALESALECGKQAGKRPTAVLLFDLDRFKIVNDRLGHANGDALLQAVSDRVRALIEPGDVAARLGGDEFALLVERMSPQDIERFASRLMNSIGGVYDIGEYQTSIGVSIGVAFASGASDGKGLLKQADDALYEAKAAGGDRVQLYDAAMEQMAETGRVLEQDLRDGMHRSEFEVFYQRQVDLKTDLIVGVEALVRWKHPRFGYVSPAKFIPAAERIGLIEDLGAFVLRQACRDAAGWPIPIKVSVNLSARQLSRGDFATTLAESLAVSGLPPDLLDLELTETLLMENDEVSRGVLGRIRDLGVRLALDDFGTGYSSLGYLKSFAIDKIKIDQSFVRDLPNDRSSIAIIRAVVSLAESLGIRVNAEGVETVEQMNLLRVLGCDEVQGFLHGKPEPSAAIVQSLTHQSGLMKVA